jgi:hypothetical protein
VPYIAAELAALTNFLAPISSSGFLGFLQVYDLYIFIVVFLVFKYPIPPSVPFFISK